jgi:hypothetical protein
MRLRTDHALGYLHKFNLQFLNYSRNFISKEPEISSTYCKFPATHPCSELNGSFAILFLVDPVQNYPWSRPLRGSYLPRAQSLVKFPFLTSFERISPSPRLCETFRKAVSCYEIELLANHRTKLKDTPYRISATVHSVYYQLPSISGDSPLHYNLTVVHTVMTSKHLVRLMIHSNYHDSFYHRLVFSVSLTVLLKKFTPQPDLTSIINAFFLLSIIDLVLILNSLLTSFWHLFSSWLLTDILAWRNIIYNAKPGREVYPKLQEWSQQPFVRKLLIFSTWLFLQKTSAVDLRTRDWAGRS